MSLTAEINAPTEKDLFLKQLRSQTGYWHQKLEETSVSKSLLTDGVSVEEYKNYLCKMYGFVLPFEERILPKLKDILPDIRTRKKAHLLADDLQSIGMTPTEINALPIFVFDENIQEPNAMGNMYVMEGATLGGAVIYKHISKTLGLTTDHGASYFYGYGNATGSSWKAFIHALTDYAIENNVGQQVTDSAEHTFKNIHNWFQQ